MPPESEEERRWRHAESPAVERSTDREMCLIEMPHQNTRADSAQSHDTFVAITRGELIK